MCVSLWCMKTRVHIYRDTQAFVLYRSQRKTSVSCSIVLCRIPWDRVSSWAWNWPFCLGWLAHKPLGSTVSASFYPTLGLIIYHRIMLSFYMGAGGPNSGPQRSTLLTEPFPQPKEKDFMVLNFVGLWYSISKRILSQRVSYVGVHNKWNAWVVSENWCITPD